MDKVDPWRARPAMKTPSKERREAIAAAINTERIAFSGSRESRLDRAVSNASLTALYLELRRLLSADAVLRANSSSGLQ
jgi:hypothetical protein